MPENDSLDINFKSCPYCGWEFPDDFLLRAMKNNENIYCEGCGTNIPKGTGNMDDNESRQKYSGNRGSRLKQIYVSLRNKKNPIDKVLGDSDLPLIYKKNYIIVVSRIIYFYFLEMKQNLEFDFQNNGLTNETVEIIYNKIKPVIKDRIQPNFLKNLRELNIKRFEKFLKIQQSKLRVSEKYLEDLIYFLKWLIEKVFVIIADLWNKDDLLKFDRIIRDDLKAFYLNWVDNSTIVRLQHERNAPKSCDIKNINLTPVLEKITITNSFRGSLLNKVKDVVYNLIESENLHYRDFNSESLIINILNDLDIPSTNDEIDNSNIIDKKTAKRRLVNKKVYISILGKIMIDILNFTSNDTITDISERYNVSRGFTTKTARYLSEKQRFELKDRFPTTSARGSGSSPSIKTMEEIKTFSKNFKDPELIIEKSKEIFNELISGPKKLTVDDLPLGYKTDPKYLAYSIIYYVLRHKSYSKKYNEYESLGVMEFINQNFPDDTTMKLAMTNIIPTLYNYLPKNLQNEILYYPIIKIPKEEYDRTGFLAQIENLRRNYEEIKRHDNVILIDLIMSTLKTYKNGGFSQFINDLQFWIKINKAWVLLEKLSIPDTLRRKSDLEDFLKGFFDLIKNLNLSIDKKEKITNLLLTFEEMRYKHYNYENSYKEKKRRGYERRLTYGDYFFNPKSRIKRFILMLGFNPYDGFDIWGNRIKINGEFKIYANFHHYHYNPNDQSAEDLVYIPVKPPKKFRTRIYKDKKFLTHNMIAGREGHLKRNTVSPEKKQQIRNELLKIEKRIAFNSKLIKLAVLNFDSKLLTNLKGWSKESIKQIKARLLDENFEWTKGIEKSIPLTKEYAQKKIPVSNVKKIIEFIIEERKKSHKPYL